MRVPSRCFAFRIVGHHRFLLEQLRRIRNIPLRSLWAVRDASADRAVLFISARHNGVVIERRGFF